MTPRPILLFASSIFLPVAPAVKSRIPIADAQSDLDRPIIPFRRHVRRAHISANQGWPADSDSDHQARMCPSPCLLRRARKPASVAFFTAPLIFSGSFVLARASPLAFVATLIKHPRGQSCFQAAPNDRR